LLTVYAQSPIKGKSDNLKLSADVKVGLSGLTKKLADLGIKGDADYQTSTWQGILQKDIAGLVKKKIDCRMAVFKVLNDKLFTTPKPVEPFTTAVTTAKAAEPLLRISYQNWDREVIVVFENIGDAPANWFTADITSKDDPFSFGFSNADFDLHKSGGSGWGTWTVISGKNILPQQKGMVILKFDGGKAELNPPKIKSDSKYIFVNMNLSWGPEEKTKK